MQPALDAHLRVAVMTRELADGEYRAAMEHRGELMEALLAEMAGVAERESVGEILAALPGFDEQLGPTGEAAAERERLRRQAKGLVDLMMVQLGDAKQAADPPASLPPHPTGPAEDEEDRRRLPRGDRLARCRHRPGVLLRRSGGRPLLSSSSTIPTAPTTTAAMDSLDEQIYTIR